MDKRDGRAYHECHESPSWLPRARAQSRVTVVTVPRPVRAVGALAMPRPAGGLRLWH